MIECNGCHNHYHPECVATAKGQRVEDLRFTGKVGKTFMCNLEGYCVFLRDSEYVKNFLKYNELEKLDYLEIENEIED